MVQIISNQLWWHFLQLESVPAPYQESWILRRPPCATTIAPHSLILPLVSEVMSTYIVYILWRGIVNVSDTLVENFGSCNPGCCLRGETADGKGLHDDILPVKYSFMDVIPFSQFTQTICSFGTWRQEPQMQSGWGTERFVAAAALYLYVTVESSICICP